MNKPIVIKLDAIKNRDSQLRDQVKPELYAGMDDCYLIEYNKFEDKYSKKNQTVILERLVFLKLKPTKTIYKIKLIDGEVMSIPDYKIKNAEFWKTLSRLELFDEYVITL